MKLEKANSPSFGAVFIRFAENKESRVGTITKLDRALIKNGMYYDFTNELRGKNKSVWQLQGYDKIDQSCSILPKKDDSNDEKLVKALETQGIDCWT